MPLLSFQFANFAALYSGRGRGYLSKKVLDYTGRGLQLQIYPGGKRSGKGDPANGCVDRDDNEEDEVFVSLYVICHYDTSDVKASYSFIVRDANGVVAYRGATEANANWGTRKFKERSFFLDKSNNILSSKGTLTIDLDLQVHDSLKLFSEVPNRSVMNILDALKMEKYADVAFELNDGIIVRAHKFILAVNAPMLANFCKWATADIPVKLTNTSSKVFRILLQYVYGGVAPNEEEVVESGLKIIEYADRYAIVGLKIAVENRLMAYRVVNVSNVADFLLFAHAHNCPLLEEYATHFFITRAEDILNTEYMGKLTESPELMQKLMLAMAPRKSPMGDKSELQKKNVIELRKRLSEKGLDIDGSKEVLISRIELNKKQRND